MKLFFLSLNIAIIQLSSVYLRYLPFRADLTADEIKIFWRKMFLLCGIIIAADVIIFAIFGVSPLLYKIILLFGMSFYFALSVILIRKKFIYHIFVLGMQGLWTLLLHTLASITISLLKNFFVLNEIAFQSFLYLFFFVILWRVEVKLFENILPTRHIMEPEFKWYVALLPLPMFLGIFMSMFDNILIQPFKERLVRFFIPLFFFMFYRSINLLTLQIEQKNRQEYLNRILNQQLQTLRAQDSVIQENQKQVAVFRHDLRHNYRLIAAMLQENKIEAAIEFISRQDKLLCQVEVANAAKNSILHSVISIYRKKAQELSINFEEKIHLPAKYSGGDFTILISNLLDDAINFFQAREIFLSISYDAKNIFLEFSSLNGAEIIFENSSCNTVKILETFKQKHSAKIKIVQAAERLNISVSFKKI